MKHVIMLLGLLVSTLSYSIDTYKITWVGDSGIKSEYTILVDTSNGFAVLDTCLMTGRAAWLNLEMMTDEVSGLTVVKNSKYSISIASTYDKYGIFWRIYSTNCCYAPIGTPFYSLFEIWYKLLKDMP